MPTELIHTYTLTKKYPLGFTGGQMGGSTIPVGGTDRRVTVEKQVKPLGSFSIVTSKEEYRYYLSLEGTMTFKDEDFDFINSSHDETEFFITCDFRGVEWKGYFTKMHCNIHTSKRYLEVSPVTDDDYRKIEPYMGVDLNILPPLKGFRADTVVSGVRQFKKERKTIEITQPYDGPNKENWIGYSVNDWVNPPSHANQNYGGFFNTRNSLIYYFDKKRQQTLEEAQTTYMIGSSHWVQGRHYMANFYWFDYQGFVYAEDAEFSPEGFFNKLIYAQYNIPQCFTLSEITNHYDENGEWERCELVYEREVWEGESKPPIGDINYLSALLHEHIRDGGTPESFGLWELPGFLDWVEFLSNIGHLHSAIGGWVFDYMTDKWYRRPFGMSGINISGESDAEKAQSMGDGTWYTELLDFGDRKAQALYFNHNYGTLEDVYSYQYGQYKVRGRYHRIASLVRKFLAFVGKEGGEVFPLDSKFFLDMDCPVPHVAGENEWRDTLIGHNSDIKRPESTEKADIEKMSFEEFLNMICAVSNTGWAVVNGVFYLEHAFFFENGFTYDEIDFGIDMEGEEELLINPMGIYNLDKDMNFLKLSNEYRYERGDMQKFEVFQSAGGREPVHNNTRIVYQSFLTNNFPRENTREISLGRLSGDHDWIRSDEAPDAGLGYLQARLTDYEMKPEGEDVSYKGRLLTLTFPQESGFEFTFYKDGETPVTRTLDRALGESLASAIADFKESFNADKPFGTITVHSANVDAALPNLCYIKFFDSDEVDMLPIQILSTHGISGGFQQSYIHADESDMVIDYYVYEIPFTLDEFDRYRVNEKFRLQDIVWRYHWYGRSFKRGEINGEKGEFLTRHFVHHDISFPYRHQLNPYKKIITELGVGIIKGANFNTKNGLFDVTVGYQEGVVHNVVVPEFDPPPAEKDLVAGIYFYRHVQEEESSEWHVHHGLNTMAFLRPIVYVNTETGLEEVMYDSLFAMSDNYVILTFTKPIAGEAYFLSFGLYPSHHHVQDSPSAVWNVVHGLDTENILHSVVWRGGAEIGYDLFEIEDANELKIHFTRPVTGEIYVAESPVGTQVETGQQISIVQDKNYPLKPLVMYMNKEIQYDSNIVEDALIKLGFTKEVIATIILKQHD